MLHVGLHWGTLSSFAEKNSRSTKYASYLSYLVGARHVTRVFIERASELVKTCDVGLQCVTQTELLH